MIKTLTGDHFYEYFMKVMDSGVKFYEQKNVLDIKTIDESWVNNILETLPALDNILRNPRRFVEREEVVVPIDLAKNTGAEAVRHLSTHTHLIDRVDAGNFVIPKKIMNIYNEDSFDIYENRFVITLINKIDEFLIRRYDALYDAIGKIFHSTLKVDSEFNDKDNDEKIAYNLTLKIRQGNSYIGDNADAAKVFENIEHIRRMVNGYKQSEFYLAMRKCIPVKSPIKRTNLMIKDHNFKKCYDLWNFLEKYTQAGYTVQTFDKRCEFNEKYVDELNTLALFNYVVMKNSLDDESNKSFDVLSYRRRRTIKPKFISKIIEDYIADCDITEQELKKFLDSTLKKAYQAKHKNNENKIIIALTAALNRGIGEQENAKKEKRVLQALEKIFSKKK